MFQLSDSLGILIMFSPILLAIFAAKRYNIIHGLVVYLFFSYAAVYGSQYLELGIEGVLTPEIMNYGIDFYRQWHDLLLELINKIPEVSSIFAGQFGEYILPACYVVVFLIFQAIASKLRSVRVERIQKAKRDFRKY